MGFDMVEAPSENQFSVLISNTGLSVPKESGKYLSAVVWFHNGLLIVGKSISGYIAKGSFINSSRK